MATVIVDYPDLQLPVSRPHHLDETRINMAIAVYFTRGNDASSTTDDAAGLRRVYDDDAELSASCGAADEQSRAPTVWGVTVTSRRGRHGGAQLPRRQWQHH